MSAAVQTLRRAAGCLAASDPVRFSMLVQGLRLAAAHLERGNELAAGEIMQRAIMRLDEATEEVAEDESRAIVQAVARLILAGAHPEIAMRTVSGTRAIALGIVEAVWAEKGAQAALRLAREGR